MESVCCTPSLLVLLLSISGEEQNSEYTIKLSNWLSLKTFITQCWNKRFCTNGSKNRQGKHDSHWSIGVIVAPISLTLTSIFQWPPFAVRKDGRVLKCFSKHGLILYNVPAHFAIRIFLRLCTEGDILFQTVKFFCAFFFLFFVAPTIFC